MGEKVSQTKRIAIKLLAESHGVSYQTASAIYNGKQIVPDMTNEQASQIIHEERGLCWHALVEAEQCDCEGECKYPWGCCACGEKLVLTEFHAHCVTLNPDYTAPTSYLEAMAWAKEDVELWKDFIASLTYKILRSMKGIDNISAMTSLLAQTVASILLDKEKGSHALAEFLEGREG